MMWKKQPAASRRGVTFGVGIVLLALIATIGDLRFMQAQVRRKSTTKDSSYKGQVKVGLELEIKASLPESLGKVVVESDIKTSLPKSLGQVEVAVESTKTHVELKAQRQVEVRTNEAATSPLSNCYISSYGGDGIGHQMEAKMSCLATAVMLNLTYAHQPVQQLEHDEDPAFMEDLFGFSAVVPQLPDLAVFYNSSTMKLKKRNPQPWVGRCQEASWFDTHKETCAGTQNAKRTPVYSRDNCWDFFWCQESAMPDRWWQSVVPVLRNTFLSGRLLETTIATTNRVPGRLLVVLHVRMGDAGRRRTDGAWVLVVLQNLRDAASENGVGLEIVVHTDGERGAVQDMLGINNETTTKDIVSIYSRGDERATLERALYDMVMADVLVSADSSLSHTAALLRNREQGPVIHPDTHERSRMGALLGWHMMRKTKAASRVEVCTEMPTKNETVCGAWTRAETDYWSTLVRKADKPTVSS